MTVKDVLLVGVDGSTESLDTVDWAIARSKRAGARVHVLCAYSLPSFTASSLDGGYAAIDDNAIRKGAQEVVDEAVARIEAAGLEASGSLEAGDPVSVLVEMSHEVSMIAIGRRSSGGLADRLLGTVSSALPAHSACPVVVVPTHSSGSAFTPIKRIVVGVDGSEVAVAALQKAVKEAKLWGSELTAVSAVPMASGSGVLAWLPAAVDRDAVLSDVRAGLDVAVDQAVAGSDLKVSRHALDGNPAALLAEFSTAVDLVVMGTRGRGGFTGLLLGSTSQTVLSHSTCPVMVVPTSKSHDSGPSPTTAWERR